VSTSRTYASLRLFKEDLDPDAVSAQLDLVPTHAHRAGESRTHGSPYREGCWLITTKENESLVVNDHVAHLLDLAERSLDAFLELQASGVRCDVFCYWETKNGQGGLELEPREMRRLGALNLAISFDVYNFADDEDGEVGSQGRGGDG
jgi:hypothetical protein